jgi:hypothetical protein
VPQEPHGQAVAGLLERGQRGAAAGRGHSASPRRIKACGSEGASSAAAGRSTATQDCRCATTAANERG